MRWFGISRIVRTTVSDCQAFPALFSESCTLFKKSISIQHFVQAKVSPAVLNQHLSTSFIHRNITISSSSRFLHLFSPMQTTTKKSHAMQTAPIDSQHIILCSSRNFKRPNPTQSLISKVFHHFQWKHNENNCIERPIVGWHNKNYYSFLSEFLLETRKKCLLYWQTRAHRDSIEDWSPSSCIL